MQHLCSSSAQANSKAPLSRLLRGDVGGVTKLFVASCFLAYDAAYQHA